MSALKKPTGQTLLTFAALLFLITVLVCMSLSVIVKVRERIELQNATDSAAYSAATIVARGFNTISLANRAQVANMVAMGGVQSLISWTSLYRAEVYSAHGALDELVDSAKSTCQDCRNGVGNGYSSGCKCECDQIGDLQDSVGKFKTKLDDEEARIKALWDQEDLAAGKEGRAFRDAALSSYQFMESIYEGDIRFYARPQRAAFHAALAAAEGDAWDEEWRAPYANDFVSMREIDHAVGQGEDKKTRLDAGMGSRGYSFVTGRGEDAPFTNRFNELLQQAVGSGSVLNVMSSNGAGSTYFDSVRKHGTQEATDTFVQAEDHGIINVAFTPTSAACSGRGSAAQGFAEAFVTASKYSCGCGEVHYWTGGGDHTEERHVLKEACPEPPKDVPPPFDWSNTPDHPKCTTPDTCVTPCGPCSMDGETVSTGNGRKPPGGPLMAGTFPVEMLLGYKRPGADACSVDAVPGLWPPFLDHNRTDDEGDLYGQPKILSILQRDYKKRGEHADPWNVLSNVETVWGPQKVRNDGLQLEDGTDVSMQTAMAAGMVYYHHLGGGGWREDANFLNPFWRSTLVTTDVDREGANGDVPNTLYGSGAPLAAKAYMSLKSNGYKGF